MTEKLLNTLVLASYLLKGCRESRRFGGAPGSSNPDLLPWVSRRCSDRPLLSLIMQPEHALEKLLAALPFLGHSIIFHVIGNFLIVPRMTLQISSRLRLNVSYFLVIKRLFLQLFFFRLLLYNFLVAKFLINLILLVFQNDATLMGLKRVDLERLLDLPDLNIHLCDAILLRPIGGLIFSNLLFVLRKVVRTLN